MAKSAEKRGVKISVDSPVKRVLVEGKAAIGVELVSGEKIYARSVISNLNPKLLFERLIAKEYLDEDFRRRIAAYNCRSGTFRMNVALSVLPDFTCLPGKHMQKHHQSGIMISPSMQYLDKA